MGRGLGRELARRLSAAGDEVWGSTRTPATGHDAALDLAGNVTIDLADESSIVAAAAQLAGQIDGLDLLVNCAGTDAQAFGAPPDQRGPFDFDATVFDAVMAVNVTGPMLVTRHLLPLLRTGRDAMVVNVSSQLGSMQVAARKGRDTAYCVSKAALNMLSVKSAAALRADGIGVVLLHPGWVQTDMGGDRAPMTIDESAGAIVDTLDSLTLEDTGRFVRWDGHDHPW